MNAMPLQVRIRHVVRADADCWTTLRCELWPDGKEDHRPEIESFFAATLDQLAAVLVAESTVGVIVGFAELSIRADVAGLEGQRAGYVEGLYVRPEARKRDIARKLLQASRSWARQKKCQAFASDRAGRAVIDKSF
jgi:aminoglycoside 6'-N-acetyltransferase I